MDFWDQSLLARWRSMTNLIILRTCSKAFGMAAVRLGFAVANPKLTQTLRAVKSPYNVNSVSQKIGALVMNEQEVLHQALDEIILSQEGAPGFFERAESKYPDQLYVYDSCTNFVLVRMPRGQEVFEGLLERGIAVRFMGDTLRITGGSAKKMHKLLKI